MNDCSGLYSYSKAERNREICITCSEAPPLRKRFMTLEKVDPFCRGKTGASLEAQMILARLGRARRADVSLAFAPSVHGVKRQLDGTRQIKIRE